MSETNIGLDMLGAQSTNVGGGTSTGFLDQLTQNPELLAIAMDMIGSKMAPESPFAGVGSMIGKSSLAAKAEEKSQARSEDMFKNLIQAITGKDEAGPTTLTVARDPAGTGGFQYNVKGFEEAEKKLEEAISPAVRTADEFMKDFGGTGGL